MIEFCKKVIYHIDNKIYWKRRKGRVKRLKRSRPKYGLTKQKRQTPVIVSMTSYDKRFETLDLCIKSLLRQTEKPDRLLLYLAEKDRKALPDTILDLQKYGLEIIFVGEDLKPHKKYYYAMKDNPDAIVITTDDDVVYDKHLIEGLLKTHRLFPNSIVAARARIIATDSECFLPYDNWKLAEVANEPSIKLLATGVGGVLYPPHLLNREQLLNIDHVKEFLHVDDLWLKTVEIIDNVPTVLCDPDVDKNRIEIVSAQSSGLSQVNVLENRNDKYWSKLNQEYDLFARLRSCN